MCAEARSGTLEGALAQAIAHHQGGRLLDAERFYRLVLNAQPRHPDANHNIGLLAVQAGRVEAALPYFKTALDAHPSEGQFWLSYIDALIRVGQPQAALDVLTQGRWKGLSGSAVATLSDWANAAVRGGEPFAVALSHHMAGRLDEAVEGYQRTVQVKPGFEDAHLNLGLALYTLGRLDEAAVSYRHALDINPDNPGANSNLGIILRDLGRLEEAETHCRRALEVSPDMAQAHYNLGVVLAGLSRLPEAAASYRRAVDIMPDFAQAHNNLGSALHDLGKLEEAASTYRRVLDIMPNFAEVHSNLGNTLRNLGKLEDAEASCRRAVEIKPDYADAHNKLGNTLYDLGQHEAAAACYRRALKIRPDYAEAHTNLGLTLMTLNRPEAALESCLSALGAQQTWAARTLFTTCIKRLGAIRADGVVRTALLAALTEPWGRPTELMPAAASLIKLDPDMGACIARANTAWPHRLAAADLFPASGLGGLSADALMLAVLLAAPVWDVALERFLTMARHALLFAAGEADGGSGEGAEGLDFRCALARQCFINEYVFDWTGGEAERALALRASLIAALAADAPVSVSQLVTVAAYFPLNSLAHCARLLERSWPEAVDALLTQQIREPEVERVYRAALARITPIECGVSEQVQRQYEENPYPRWIKASPIDKPRAIDAILRRTFPFAPFTPLGKTSGLDVLIAGCGTGQQPIDAARSYLGARILAVDLSLASLGYAKRKSAELDLASIEYGQADIMTLGGLGRSFDVIEASGVLHHLGDPLAGWRVLLSLLRPGGVMRIGLYSAAARRDVVRGRDFIAARNYHPTVEDIRRCRQDLMAADSTGGFHSLLSLSDFFSVSACRDLLFHVQEHRMTLDGIGVFLKDNDPDFLGFDIDRPIIDAYTRRFPADRAATDLRQWQRFEAENPDTFRSMYQFWVQKAG
ncbi:Type 11 methyltransferase [Candidatus Terasakiella magnetica]|nr:Type 11 methyltransferase [Candidatus Terasakiella magnetica]